MKTKTINKVIKAKIDAWADSVTDASVRKVIKNNVLVSGGCIASMLLKERVNDFDIYLDSPEAAYKLALYYAKDMIARGSFNVPPTLRFHFNDGETGVYCLQPIEGQDYPLLNEADPPKNFVRVEVYVKSQGFASEKTEQEQYEYFERQDAGAAEKFTDAATVATDEDDKGDKYRPVFMSSNAITLSHGIQIVLRFTGTPEEIHENFDFVHCTNYWTPKTGLVLSVDALASIMARELVYVGSLFPLSSIFRTRKFIQRGWSCHVGNYLKMAIQLNDLDLSKYSVLEEQLTGMDVAYLNQILQAVKGATANGATIDQTYMMTLVDRLMGDKDRE